MSDTMEKLLIVIFLIFLNAIFAMSEMALVSSKKARLQQLREKGSIGAAKAIVLKEEPSYFISTIQAGITIIGILNGIVGEKSLVEPTSDMFVSLGLKAELSHTVASIFIIIMLTYFSVVFGEIIPKRIGLILPEKMSSIFAIPMAWLSKLGFPLVWLFDTSSEIIIKVLGFHKIKVEAVSNEEVKELMEQGSDAGVFHESEQQIVSNVLHMDERKVESIMTHRNDIFHIDIEDSFEHNIEKIVNSQYSKIIVSKGSLNTILGLLHVTNLLPLIHKNQTFDFQNLLDELLYVPETIMATQVLENFKKHRKEVAVVVNEYGENIGIVTLVDIMQAIVGDVSHEDDGEEEIIEENENSIIADGSIRLNKLEQYFEVDEIPVKEGLNTLAGLIMEQAGVHFSALPTEGFECEVKLPHFTLNMKVLKMDNNKVEKVKIIKQDLMNEETLEV